jgi:hypothetical protein
MVALAYVIVGLFLVSLLAMSSTLWEISLAISVVLLIIEIFISILITFELKEES